VSGLTIEEDGRPVIAVTVQAPAGALARPWEHFAASVRVRAVALRPARPTGVRDSYVRRLLPMHRPRCRARRAVRVARGSPDDSPGEGEPARGRQQTQRAVAA
jgi:hypothetical protein